MIKSNRNQLGVAHNPAQTEVKRVLCVCSAGCLRSPTAANVLHRKLGFNTRAVGADKEFALIPISQTLITWADEVVFVNIDSFSQLEQDEKDWIESVGVRITVLNIEDDFDWGDKTLERMIFEQYTQKHGIS